MHLTPRSTCVCRVSLSVLVNILLHGITRHHLCHCHTSPQSTLHRCTLVLIPSPSHHPHPVSHGAHSCWSTWSTSAYACAGGCVVGTRDTTPCLSPQFEPPLKKLNKKKTRSRKRSADTATFATFVIILLPFCVFERCLCMHCFHALSRCLSMHWNAAFACIATLPLRMHFLCPPCPVLLPLPLVLSLFCYISFQAVPVQLLLIITPPPTPLLLLLVLLLLLPLQRFTSSGERLRREQGCSRAAASTVGYCAWGTPPLPRASSRRVGGAGRKYKFSTVSAPGHLLVVWHHCR